MQKITTLSSKADFLMLLYNSKGPVTTTAITACGLVRITAFRYVAFFKDFGFVRFSGLNKTGGYKITELGKRFAEGQPITQNDIDCDTKKKLRLHF